MKKLFLFFLLPGAFICNTANGQETKTSKATQGSDKVFNIPPGSVLDMKVKTDIDYSPKLADIPSYEPNAEAKDFLAHIPKEELADMERNSPESFAYYMRAKTFYSNLSNKVKATFSIEELWHIYMFDQKLKTTLEKIK